jgi:hypothetical protein
MSPRCPLPPLASGRNNVKGSTPAPLRDELDIIEARIGGRRHQVEIARSRYAELLGKFPSA